MTSRFFIAEERGEMIRYFAASAYLSLTRFQGPKMQYLRHIYSMTFSPELHRSVCCTPSTIGGHLTPIELKLDTLVYYEPNVIQAWLPSSSSLPRPRWARNVMLDRCDEPPASSKMQREPSSRKNRGASFREGGAWR
jgi:hypothetical protein